MPLIGSSGETAAALAENKVSNNIVTNVIDIVNNAGGDTFILLKIDLRSWVAMIILSMLFMIIQFS